MNNDSSAWLDARVRTMQIIAITLAMGALTMATLMVFLRATQGGNLPETPMLSLLACVLFFVQAGLAFTAPGFLRQAGLKRLAGARVSAAPDALLGLYQSSMIVGLALLEALVFIAAIAYFIEGREWALIPAVLGIALMALHLPTKPRVLRWLEDADEHLRRLRLAGGR